MPTGSLLNLCRFPRSGLADIAVSKPAFPTHMRIRLCLENRQHFLKGKSPGSWNGMRMYAAQAAWAVSHSTHYAKVSSVASFFFLCAIRLSSLNIVSTARNASRILSWLANAWICLQLSHRYLLKPLSAQPGFPPSFRRSQQWFHIISDSAVSRKAGDHSSPGPSCLGRKTASNVSGPDDRHGWNTIRNTYSSSGMPLKSSLRVVS